MPFSHTTEGRKVRNGDVSIPPRPEEGVTTGEFKNISRLWDFSSQGCMLTTQASITPGHHALYHRVRSVSGGNGEHTLLQGITSGAPEGSTSTAEATFPSALTAAGPGPCQGSDTHRAGPAAASARGAEPEGAGGELRPPPLRSRAARRSRPLGEAGRSKGRGHLRRVGGARRRGGLLRGGRSIRRTRLLWRRRAGGKEVAPAPRWRRRGGVCCRV